MSKEDIKVGDTVYAEDDMLSGYGTVVRIDCDGDFMVNFDDDGETRLMLSTEVTFISREGEEKDLSEIDLIRKYREYLDSTNKRSGANVASDSQTKVGDIIESTTSNDRFVVIHIDDTTARRRWCKKILSDGTLEKGSGYHSEPVTVVGTVEELGKNGEIKKAIAEKEAEIEELRKQLL